MRVLIIEDEAPAFRRLQRILESLVEDIEIVEVIDTVEESIKYLSASPALDLIFMDIQLADGLSFEIFEEVEPSAPVIFTTAYDEYALKAFKVNSIDYLLKPIDEELLQQSLNKLEKVRLSFSQSPDLKSILRSIQPEAKSYKRRFLVKQRDRLLSIKSEEIAYLFTEMGIVYIMTLNSHKYAFDKPLDQLESQLDPEQFFRINRQIIGSIEAIAAAHPFEKGKIMVELSPKLNIPTIVSREKASDFKRWMGMG